MSITNSEESSANNFGVENEMAHQAVFLGSAGREFIFYPKVSRAFLTVCNAVALMYISSQLFVYISLTIIVVDRLIPAWQLKTIGVEAEVALSKPVI